MIYFISTRPHLLKNFNELKPVFKTKQFLGSSATDVHEQIIEFVNQNDNIEIVNILSENHFTPYIDVSLLYKEELK